MYGCSVQASQLEVSEFSEGFQSGVLWKSVEASVGLCVKSLGFFSSVIHRAELGQSGQTVGKGSL